MLVQAKDSTFELMDGIMTTLTKLTLSENIAKIKPTIVKKVGLHPPF